MAARGAGFGTALGDLVGALLPLSARSLQRDLEERLNKAPTRLNEFGFDPYGLSPDWWRALLMPLVLLYRFYFRVETSGIEHLPPGRVLVVANHAGQLPFDAAMVYLDCTKNWLKMAVAKREIEYVSMGRQTKFTRAGLDRYIARRMTVPTDKRR